MVYKVSGSESAPCMNSPHLPTKAHASIRGPQASEVDLLDGGLFETGGAWGCVFQRQSEEAYLPPGQIKFQR